MRIGFRGLVPCWGSFLLLFYLLPLGIKDTGSGMVFLLLVIPAGCFLTTLLHGAFRGFHPAPAISAAALFFPSVFLFYNESALIYCVLYGAAALLGSAVGAGLGRIFRGRT